MTKTEILRHTEQDDRTRAQENNSKKLLISSKGEKKNPEYFLHSVPRLQE